MPAFAVHAVAPLTIGERDDEAVRVLRLDSNLVPGDDGACLWVAQKLRLNDRDGVASLAKIACNNAKLSLHKCLPRSGLTDAAKPAAYHRVTSSFRTSSDACTEAPRGAGGHSSLRRTVAGSICAARIAGNQQAARLTTTVRTTTATTPTALVTSTLNT